MNEKMEFSLKTYIKAVFPFEKKIGYDVLGLLSKRGGMVENQIINHLAEATRRRVNGVLQNFLVPNGFVYSKIPSKSRRNIKNAFGLGKEIRPKEYHLTLKGVLASLSVVSLKENYTIKQYLELFPRELRDIMLEYVQKSIYLYVYYNHAIGLSLNTITDLVFHMEDQSFRWDKLSIKTDERIKIKNIEEQASSLSEKLSANEDLFFLVEYWPDGLNLIIKGHDKNKIKNELYSQSISSKIDEFNEKFIADLNPTRDPFIQDLIDKALSKIETRD